MKTTITATELARNLSRVLDQLAAEGGEVIIKRNSRRVAKLVASSGPQTALEAIADLYRTIPDDTAVSWESDARSIDDSCV
jgi:antitoxin (DNA-binding transcriptional repressor) of toxin-antitoxin stability system